MNTIFKRKFQDFLSKTGATLKDHKSKSSFKITDVMRMLDETPANLLRFPTEELQELVDVPCPGRFC
jgi:hypothetical protein